MDWPATSFTRIPLRSLPVDQVAGEIGAANFTGATVAGVRMRVVDYTAGYVADHWCDLGHFGYVLAGAITIELRDKSAVALSAGEAFLVSTLGDAPHRLVSPEGATVLLVD